MFPLHRWFLRLAFSIHVVSVAAAPALVGTEIVEGLKAAVDEQAATKLVEPFLGSLKQLDPKVMETVVARQMWKLAKLIVAKSHEQKVDMAFTVRNAVQKLKNTADELTRSLNPDYGKIVTVSPAFQWAQNDTCIHIIAKYTVRWNAPGAVEVYDTKVDIAKNWFNFTGFGKHSNNKYKYFLSLPLFDNIHPTLTEWHAAAAGRLFITIRKAWIRKWPRLLADQKIKIGNMHVWWETQERIGGSLGSMTMASQSPATCALSDKLYCIPSGSCVKKDACDTCKGKSIAIEADNLCGGMPTDRAGLSFKDSDMDENEVGGVITIQKARAEYDVDHYQVYWGKDESRKLELPDGSSAMIGEAAPIGSDIELDLKANTKIPDQATHFLVFSKNQYGEYPTPGSLIIRDGYLPKEKPSSIEFKDEDGDTGEVSGTVTIGRASDEKTFTEYSLHWGKSDKRKIASASLIKDLSKDRKESELAYYISASTKIPDSATHLLVFAKNDHGEFATPASLKVQDNTRPCLTSDADSCPQGVTTKGSAPEAFTVQRAKNEEGLTHYSLYFGRAECGLSDDSAASSGKKNGHIADLEVSGKAEYSLAADANIPEGTTHVLVFAKNSFGESERCVSATGIF